MIIVMKPKAKNESIKNIINIIENKGLQAHVSDGSEVTIIGVVGDKSRLSDQNLEIFDGVDKIVAVTETYKLANKKFHPDQTLVDIGGVILGGKEIIVMSGPCAIESQQQLLDTAHAIKKSGVQILRGGAYKPRTSPYSFQGLEEEGLQFMRQAKEETGLSLVTEVTSREAVESAVKYVDMLQVGARNMQNFVLLKEVGQTNLPVLLKRGLSATIDEWLNAAEYIIAEGNPNVVLCERGIRTFETATRNTLDLSAVAVVKSKSHLPVIVDPSHATGVRKYVKPLSMASIAVGADGLMVESHPDPATALSDGPQSLTFDQLDELCREIRPLVKLMGRTF